MPAMTFAMGLLVLAAAFTSSAFQCKINSNGLQMQHRSNHRCCFQRSMSGVSSMYLSAPEDGNVKPIHSVIESLLATGNFNDAASELRHHQKSGAEVTSSFHAVIEACCAGGGNQKGQYKGQRRKSHHAGSKDSDDQLELAVSLLQSMNNATVHAHDILISGYARRGRWSDALLLLTEMENKFDSAVITKINSTETIPSLYTYQTVLTSLAHNGQYDKMMSLLTKLRRRGVKPTVYTFNTLMNICAQDKPSRWKEALSLLSQCQREPGVTPDIVTYTTAMRACARARKSNKAMEIFRVMKAIDLELDAFCYTTAMNGKFQSES